MTIKVTYNITDVYMTQSVSPVYINVSYSGGGSSGGGVWGTITGTLSNQTDLQTALDGKFDDPTGTTAQYLRGDGSLATFPSLTGYVPYTGATTNVNLGEYELKAGQLTLDVSPTGTAAVGTTRWNDTTGVSETTLKGGNVLLRNGVDLVARVVNKVTPNTTLTKAAYQAVRVSGAQGQRLAVAFAQANNDANSADTIGLVVETIATNQEGFIMAVGQLENINTTGSLQGETWLDGDVLYLSPFTAGAITKVKPTGNGHIVVIGYVEYAHANNGKIYVKVMNGWELTELHDVDIVSPANNEALIYESSTSLWKNKSIATALGYTPANAATTLTINGVTYDLSQNRSWTISAGISGSGTSGQVTYWSGASAVSGSNNLFWDAANGRLGIGTNVPSQVIQLVRNQNAQTALLVTNTTSGTAASASVNVVANNGGFSLAKNSAGVTPYKISGVNDGVFYNYSGTNNSDISFLNDDTSGRIKFAAGASSTSQMTLFANGNLAINSGVTDLGVRFGVVGDTLLRGSGSTIATTALTVQNSSSTNLLRVLNDGDVSFGADAMYWDAVTSRLGIGTNAPNSPLHINNTITASGGIARGANFTQTINASANNDVLTGLDISPIINKGAFTGVVSSGIRINGNNISERDSPNNHKVLISATSNGISRMYFDSTATGAGWNTGFSLSATNISKWSIAGYGLTYDFTIYNDSLSAAALFIKGSTNNVLIGSTSDAGQRLQVYGDTLLRGSGATSATTALTVQDSVSTTLFSVRNDNRVIIRNSYIAPYQTNNANDAIKLVSNNLGASIGVQNENAAGFSGIEYLSNAGSVRVFTGFNNNNGTEFRFNNIATNGYTTFMIGSTSAMTIKTNRQVRFHPLASAPSGAESGDVYYNSTDNKHYGYDGTNWNAFY